MLPSGFDDGGQVCIRWPLAGFEKDPLEIAIILVSNSNGDSGFIVTSNSDRDVESLLYGV